MPTHENRLLTDLDPQEVEGKAIPFKDLPRKVAMSRMAKKAIGLLVMKNSQREV